MAAIRYLFPGAILLALLPCARGHELDLTFTLVPPAVVVRATYAGADPVPFAKVRVATPAGAEFQSGTTDRRGNFSFLPDAPGPWRMAVDDDEGHRREIEIAVPDPFLPGNAAAPAAAPASRWERAATGVALLLGLTGLLYGFKARQISP